MSTPCVSEMLVLSVTTPIPTSEEGLGVTSSTLGAPCLPWVC